MHVSLRNKEKFQQLLSGYTPSAKARQILAGVDLVILQGISGAGRNTLINKLVQKGSFHFIISDTTRPPKHRDGAMEQDGVQYYFRTEEQVLSDLENGMFLEAELIHSQQVSGISVREIDRASISGKTPINEVAREGVVNIRKAKPDTTFIFVLPPSYDEWLARLAKREVMSDQELANRKQSAIDEIKEALAAADFKFIVNDDLERTSQAIINGIKGDWDETEGETAREAARDILAKLLN